MTTKFSYSDLKRIVEKIGSLSAIEGYEFKLYDLTVKLGVEDKTVVELGTLAGWSTRALLAAVNDSGGHLYSIDIERSCSVLFMDEPNWTFICGDSVTVPQTWSRKIDHLYIDTVHTFTHTLQELMLWYPFITEKGIISMHDTEYDKDEFGVKRAIQEFLKTHPELSFENDTTAPYGLGILRRKT